MENNLQIILFMVLFLGSLIILLSLFLPSANLVFQLGIVMKYKKVQLGVDYFREMLNYSPSEIYYIYNKNFRNRLNDNSFKIRKAERLLYINLLKMNLLKYVDIDFTDEKDFKVIKKDIIILDSEYKMINDYIFGHVTNSNEITLKEIYRYVYENINDGFFDKWEHFIRIKIENRGFYIGNFITFYGDRIKRFYRVTIPLIILLNIIMMLIAFKFGLILVFLSIIFLIFGFHETKNLKVISDSGIYEYRKMLALKKFLQDFSIVEERGPEASKILEDYIVYASIFGMLKRV